MYAFVDQDVRVLDEGSRLVLWASRAWVCAVSRGECPEGHIGQEIAAVFQQRGIADAFAHFGMVMLILNRHARDDLDFGHLACRRVHEGEALLLSVLSSLREAGEDDIRATLNLLVEGEWGRSCLSAIPGLGLELADMGLLPRPPETNHQTTGGGR